MEKSSSRLKVFAVLVLVMFAALSTRLWFLQVLATQVYAEEAQNNGVREVAIDALRGEIWTEDQYGKPNGEPLVQNRSSLEVRVDKQELEESGIAEQVLGELSAMLDVPVKQIELDIVVETRDRAHVDAIVAALATGGFRASLLGVVA